jgi:hypothetical protein
VKIGNPRSPAVSYRKPSASDGPFSANRRTTSERFAPARLDPDGDQIPGVADHLTVGPIRAGRADRSFPPLEKQSECRGFFSHVWILWPALHMFLVRPPGTGPGERLRGAGSDRRHRHAQARSPLCETGAREAEPLDAGRSEPDALPGTGPPHTSAPALCRGKPGTGYYSRRVLHVPSRAQSAPGHTGGTELSCPAAPTAAGADPPPGRDDAPRRPSEAPCPGPAHAVPATGSPRPHHRQNHGAPGRRLRRASRPMDHLHPPGRRMPGAAGLRPAHRSPGG